MTIGELAGQGWLQIGELGLAFVLSALIGLEREIRHKSAGLRTHTLVGFAAALIMLVSKYGFGDVLSADRIVLDPSRIAAQIVSGIGFIGGGLIFVRRDSVRGLTTAAVVWLTAAVGMACGAGLPVLAVFVTALHFVVIFVFPYFVERLPKSRWTPSPLQVTYEDGRGILGDVLVLCTRQGFAVSRVRVERKPTNGDWQATNGPSGDGETETPNASLSSDEAHFDEAVPQTPAKRVVTVTLEIQGTRSVAKLGARLAEIDGVVSVNAGDANVWSD
jgi:putative Mg2+ transporter-C (MgtC) family protein